MESKKILIVDDETVISSYLQKKFIKLGYQAFTADNGEEALKQAFLHLPDIILLDVKLPKLSGVDVCRRLKSDEKTKHIPILMLSAKAQAFEIQEGLAAGANRYLCKPLSFPEIIAEVRNYET